MCSLQSAQLGCHGKQKTPHLCLRRGIHAFGTQGSEIQYRGTNRRLFSGMQSSGRSDASVQSKHAFAAYRHYARSATNPTTPITPGAHAVVLRIARFGLETAIPGVCTSKRLLALRNMEHSHKWCPSLSGRWRTAKRSASSFDVLSSCPAGNPDISPTLANFKMVWCKPWKFCDAMHYQFEAVSLTTMIFQELSVSNL